EQDTLLQWVYPAANGCDSLVQVQIDVLSSTNEAEVAGWRAWPNPTNGSWWVSAPSEVLLWRAWDAQGRALALPLPEGSIGQNGGQYRFDLSPLPSGIYFVAALTQQGWWTGRVVRW
ncbi:MAG TPA: T9SS type A sorting domain-containing protein, partial [Saprospiraceae bacterium]|nr:T9SS type A sorting domain-containing protein [Saprospiraceae bacterium]